TSAKNGSTYEKIASHSIRDLRQQILIYKTSPGLYILSNGKTCHLSRIDKAMQKLMRTKVYKHMTKSK
ncbi:hypothetical protein KA005_55490, partial [bacterium]|nr:hypothetical protein [bacterium]